jgi:hypothetical protein
VASHEILPIAVLQKRLSEVRAGEFHLRRELPLDNPYNAILRFTDILRYIDVQAWEVFSMFPGLERVYNRMRPDRKPNLKRKVTRRKDELQLRLSQFFHGWDNGSLLKRPVGKQWLIVGRHDGEGMAQVDEPKAAPAYARSIKMRIDVTTLGPKLRGG